MPAILAAFEVPIFQVAAGPARVHDIEQRPSTLVTSTKVGQGDFGAVMARPDRRRRRQAIAKSIGRAACDAVVVQLAGSVKQAVMELPHAPGRGFRLIGVAGKAQRNQQCEQRSLLMMLQVVAMDRRGGKTGDQRGECRAFGNNVAAGVRRLQDGAARAGTQIGEAIEYTTSRHLDLAGQMKIPGTRQQATQHLAIELDRNLQQAPCGKLGEKMIKGRQRTGRDNHQLILGRSGGDGPHQAVCLGDIWRCAHHRPFAVGVCFSRAEAGKICARHQTPLQREWDKVRCHSAVVPSIRKAGVSVIS